MTKGRSHLWITRCLPVLTTVMLSLLLAACSSGGQADLSSDSSSQPPALSTLPALPFGDADSRGTAAVVATLQNGSDAVSNSAGASVSGSDLAISAGPGGLEWGMYRFDPAGSTLVAAQATMNIGSGTNVWLAIANYGTLRWQFIGPFPAAGSAHFVNLGTGNYLSPGGGCYLLVLACDSTAVNVVSVEFTADDAPATYSISGAITSSAGGTPLLGAVVQITPGGASATTNASGVYMVSGLAAGTYTVSASLNGYTFAPPSQDITVGPNAGGVDFVGTPTAVPATYTADIAPIMTQYCTGCHDAATPSAGIPLTTYAEVSSAATLSMNAINSDFMPMGPSKLTAGEKQKFQDWIDGGKLE